MTSPQGETFSGRVLRLFGVLAVVVALVGPLMERESEMTYGDSLWMLPVGVTALCAAAWLDARGKRS